MDRQPVLEGERLLLRPLRETDRGALYAVARDPEIWAKHPVSTRWQEPVFTAFFDDLLASGGALAAIDKHAPGGPIVGSSSYRPLASDPAAIETGWTFLARAYWGGSYNAEMKRLMLRHAHRFVDRVVFRVGQDNIRSRRAMEKIGGVLTAETEMIDTPGGPVPYVYFEITRGQFAAGPLASG
jgi:RimJ/RimL family protein N-acetyltransferase